MMRKFKSMLSALVMLGLPVSVTAEALINSANRSDYALNPESVMPGYCQRGDNGHIEGIFRTAENGITVWRNYSPDTGGSMLPMILKDQLAEKIAAVEFSLASTNLNWGVYTLFGSLSEDGNKQDVIMRLHPLGEDTYNKDENHYAATVVPAEHQAPDVAELDSHSGLQFCILLSASRQQVPLIDLNGIMYSAR